MPDLSKCVDVQWTFVIRRSYGFILPRHACDQIPDACERRGGEAAPGGGCARARPRETAQARGCTPLCARQIPAEQLKKAGLAPSAPRRACGRGSHRRGCRGGCPRRCRTRARLPARPSPLRQRWTREAAAGRAQAPHKLLQSSLHSRTDSSRGCLQSCNMAWHSRGRRTGSRAKGPELVSLCGAGYRSVYQVTCTGNPR